MSEHTILQRAHAVCEKECTRSASLAMKTLESVAEEIARTKIPVLILGDSGTGKQVIAQRIHEMSVQRDQGLWHIDCATLTADSFDSEFRLRNQDRKASFTGTVILDKVADLDEDCQRKLLHILPDGENSTHRQVLNARLISTTSENLIDNVRGGRFRNDLFYRLNGVCLRIPALQERAEDIPSLVDVLLQKHAVRLEKPLPRLSEDGMRRLMGYSWPGNVRELENVVMKVVALGDEESGLADLSLPSYVPQAKPRTNSLKAAARAASREAEREMILEALTKTRWNRKRAARELQISYKSLLYKLKQIGFEEPNHLKSSLGEQK